MSPQRRSSEDAELKASAADPARIRALLSRYKRVRLTAQTEGLSEGDLASLPHLVAAAQAVDDIYWQQRSVEGWRLVKQLRSSPGDAVGDLERLLTVNFGPWDSLNGDAPFLGGARAAPGANFYPADLTREELAEYLRQHPEQRD